MTMLISASLMTVTPSPASAASTFPLNVDFGVASTVPPAGYVLDHGQPYGARTGADQGSGNTYGWVGDGTSTPLDLTADGRVRSGTGITDSRLTAFMHMQRTPGAPGAWEVEVPNGEYTVTVVVGDAANIYDSTHAATVEGQVAVPPFTPTPTAKFEDGTVTVAVADGRLTVRPEGGVNTKIAYLTIVVAADPVVPTLPVKVDFGAPTSTPPAGNVLDYGQAYGRKGANTYGWVRDGTTTPLSLTQNGRQRGTTGLTDVRLSNFMHMQYTGSSSGNPTPGAWELAVHDGTYRVTVAVGDAQYNFDSSHSIVVEGQISIAPFTPTSSKRFETATVDVTVTDGRLTVRPTGGTNTKIDYVEVDDWTQPPVPPFPLKIDYGATVSQPASGYTLDYGAPFAARPGGYTFGWVADGTSTPVDLSKNGRQRYNVSGVTTDSRLTNLVHMQWGGSPTGGNPTPGAWELTVPNGTYKVTVAVGDAGNSFDSQHAIAVEGSQLIQPYTPTIGTRFKTATITVSVIDGRLTIAPTNGVNTKIDYIDIDSVDVSRPRVLTVAPADESSGVFRDTSVTAELYLPVGAIDPNTVTSATVRLVNVADGAVVPAGVNTSGGGDVLVLTPVDTLEAATGYRFEITDGVKDVAGNAFLPHLSTFSTGQIASGTGIPGVAFDKVETSATGQLFTSVTIGPDRKLYAATLTGFIARYTIEADGTLSGEQLIPTVRNLNDGENRTIIGLAFDPASTPANPILWVTDNFMYLGNDDVPDWSSKLVRLTGADLQNGQAVLVNLPRSAHDHEANSIAFGPDGKLYFPMGSNTGMGSPDVAWANRPEVLLSGAVLRLDPDLLPAQLPLDVKTPDGGGSYDPLAPGAPLTLHATGVRNAYDLLWHSNGQLYAPTNGSAAGANIPGVPSALPDTCSTTRPDLAPNGPWTYSGPTVNAISGNPAAQTDFVHRIQAGGYYGHPNPARCEYISYGGNPTSTNDPWQEGQYPVGVPPDRNFRSGDVYDAGLHASANGVIEYRSDVLGTALKGKLLVVRYSAGKDIMVMDPGGSAGKIISTSLGVTGFTGFDDPLDLVEDPATGNIYVTELGGAKITLLRPRVEPPRPGAWSTEPALPQDLLDAGGAAIDGRIYVVDGKTSSGPQSSLHIYDTATRAWSTGAGLPGTPVENPAVVSHEGQLYVFGGSSQAMSGATTNVHRYDPATDVWTALPPMATARGGPAAVVVGDDIWVIGGMDGSGESLASTEVYNIPTDAWSAGPAMATARDNPGAATAAGTVYVFGGRTRLASGTVVNGTLATMEALVPGAGAWQPAASMPTGRRSFAVGVVDGKIVAAGGEATPSGGAFPHTEAYDPVTGSWQEWTSMPTPRHGMAAAVVADRLHTVGGGATAGAAFSSVHQVLSP